MEAVKRIVQESYEQAQSQQQQHRPALLELAGELMKTGTQLKKSRDTILRWAPDS